MTAATGRESLLQDVPTTLDDDIVRAVAWCRLGSGAGYGYPENNGFTRAEKLGLLDHTGVWRATPQGEGVLIALGLLDPTWQAERTRISVLWARETNESKPVQFVAAWPEGIEDCWPDLFAHEVAETQKRWQSEWTNGGQWEFWTTVVEIPRAVTS